MVTETPNTDNGMDSTRASNPVADAATATKNRFASFDGVPPQNEIVTVATAAYLDAVDPDDPPEPRLLEKQLLSVVNGVLKMVNPKASTSQEKLPLQRTLTYWQVAQVLLRLHHVKRIAPSKGSYDREYDLIGMYVDGGPNRGLHTSSEDDIRTSARQYNTQLSLNEFKEIMAVLREDAPRRYRCTHRDIVPVNNGLVFFSREDRDIEVEGRTFQFKAKALHSFDPDLIFLAKPPIDFYPDAPNPVIVHPVDKTRWDIESWIDEFFDEPGQEGMAELIWEIIGAAVRPGVRWGKSAWFYSELGNNGKGTLCSLLRNLVGSRSHTSIPLSEMGKDFALEPLTHASSIIVDENDVGTFIDKAANLKTIQTNDVLQINRKYRMPIAYQFWGFMIQCLNELPRVKDKSESFYRRQLFVPFTKSFTGHERKYIKDDYLQRKEVLEYVLRRVLVDMDNYQLSEPPATKALLAEYKDFNDPVRTFWEEFRLRLVWDLAPFPFLYDLYKAWFSDVSPSGSPVSNKQFIKDLEGIVRDDSLWHCKPKVGGKYPPQRPGSMMAAGDPLIAEYELKKWMNPSYKGSDPKKIGQPMLQANYRGLLRHLGPAAAATTNIDGQSD